MIRPKPLLPGTKRMRSGRSTGKPTKAEAAHIVAAKEGPCLACLIWTGDRYHGCDAHHLLSGGRRIGHAAVIGLCAYHHRGVPHEGVGKYEARLKYGPSLMDGSRLFRDAYGDDAKLFSMQMEELNRAA